MSGGAQKPPGAPASKGSVIAYKAELRRAVRRNATEPEINFLNITAMLDIMTIILVFLLKSLGESAAAIPQSDDLRLPNSIVTQEPHDQGILVTVSKTQILVGENKILSLPSRESVAQTGVGAQHKRGGPFDPYIVPLGNALQVARRTDVAIRRAKGQDTRSSAAVIIADQLTPYRLLVEVLYTLGQSEFGEYHLMVMQAKTTR
jgi:biopolymer transport protein ExbD